MRLLPRLPLTDRHWRWLSVTLCVLFGVAAAAATLLQVTGSLAPLGRAPAPTAGQAPAKDAAGADDVLPLIAQPPPAAGPGTPLGEGDQVLAIGELTLQVTAQPLQLSLLASDGADIWQTTANGVLRARAADGTWHDAVRLQSAARLDDGSIRLELGTDAPDQTLLLDVQALAPRLLRLYARGIGQAGVQALAGSIMAQPDEHFVGLGERFTGIDQRGRIVDMWAEDRRVAEYGDSTYAPIPLVLSSRGYSAALEGFARSRFDLAASNPDAWTWEQDSSDVSLIVGHGATLKDLIRLHARATGMPPLPPVWAFGTIKAATGGTQQVIADAQRIREQGIPVSAIFAYDTVNDYADIGWPSVSFAGRSAGPYPDPAAYTAALHDLGFKALTYFSPDLHTDRTNYGDAEQDGVLVQDATGEPYLHPTFRTSWLDFTNPSAAAWWEERFRRSLGELGYDGGMLDLGELLPADARFADGSTGREGHNRYPLLYAHAAWQAAQSVQPDGDVLLMVRSGAMGAQRYQSLQWPGDPRMRWDGPDGFQSLLPAGLSFGLSGFPYWHPEVAGYLQADLGPARERELWLRWLQFATWSPTLRDHYGEHPNDPIDAWKDAETLAAFRDAARMHAALVPYLYAAAAEAHRDGVPIMRYLPLEVPDDPRAWGEEQSYFLGSDLLVAPVLTPDARERRVYLPAGADWVDYWTGRMYRGGQEVSVGAPLIGGQTPVFARAGAILPLAAPYDSLVSSTVDGVRVYTDDLELRLIPGGPGATSLADGTRLSWDGNATLRVEDSPVPRAIGVTWPDGRTSAARVSGTAILQP
jgi:alpha-glucosidase (family GH31 glycosyl hydrolase)